ncbi:MAG: hypothetical protein AB9869_04770 [Verrucomicrobiia bacterium]
MKNLLLTTMVLGAMAAIQASASLVTFEDLGQDWIASIPDGYAGVNWGNLNVMDVSKTIGPSGYHNGLVSGNNVAFNGFGNSALISNNKFNLTSAYLTGAFRDDLQVQVIGSYNSAVIYDNTYTIQSTAPTLIQFNYTGVDSVQFISSGGYYAGYNSADGTHFVMDNLTIDVVPVPEPSTYLAAALLLLPLWGSAMRHLRNRNGWRVF